MTASGYSADPRQKRKVFAGHAVAIPEGNCYNANNTEKENSPFDVTFVIAGCANYIGNKAAFAYRSYETDTGLCVSGTGEKPAEEYVRLLNEIK